MRLTLKHRVLTSRARKGWHSFFIEIFEHGERRYQPLDMVANPADKAQYRQTVQFCKDLIARRQLEMKGLASGLVAQESDYAGGDFIAYCKQVADRSKNQKTRENWHDGIKSLECFSRHGLTFREVDHHWLESYQDFLMDAYSQNTARSYSTKIRQVISKAHKDGYLTDNPNKRVQQIPEKEGEIKYLYLEEVMLLHKTPHRHVERKTAFLFNCFVPVRPGDLANIKESNIRPDGAGGYEVYFRQSKKQRIESIPIAHQGMVYLEQARELARKRLGRELNANDKIFNIGCKKGFGGMLKVWATRAYDLYARKLEPEVRNHFSWACKDVSPHWARHTGATMLLNAGAQLDAVGDILGHRDKKTTMRYAKIHPRTKRTTIAMMPSIKG